MGKLYIFLISLYLRFPFHFSSILQSVCGHKAKDSPFCCRSSPCLPDCDSGHIHGVSVPPIQADWSPWVFDPLSWCYWHFSRLLGCCSSPTSWLWFYHCGHEELREEPGTWAFPPDRPAVVHLVSLQPPPSGCFMTWLMCYSLFKNLSPNFSNPCFNLAWWFPVSLW